jgi:hypothetical protein
MYSFSRTLNKADSPRATRKRQRALYAQDNSAYMSKLIQTHWLGRIRPMSRHAPRMSLCSPVIFIRAYPRVNVLLNVVFEGGLVLNELCLGMAQPLHAIFSLHTLSHVPDYAALRIELRRGTSRAGAESRFTCNQDRRGQASCHIQESCCASLTCTGYVSGAMQAQIREC